MDVDDKKSETRNKAASFNPDKHLIFSKLKFGNEEDQKLIKKKERQRFNDLPTGKQYNVLIQKIDKIEQEISGLEKEDAALAEEQKKKLLWRKALAKSAGFIVRDNRDQAEQMLEKKMIRKKKSEMKWKERLEKVDKQKKDRQIKRKKNIKERTMKKIKKKRNKIK